MNRIRVRLALRIIAGYHPALDDIKTIDPAGLWERIPDPTIVRDLAIEALIEEMERL